MVAIAGCGGLGSHLAWYLSRLGIKNIRLFDADIVADHNIANQVFGEMHIGMPKAAALAEGINRMIGTRVQAVREFVTESRDLAPVVFLCVDTMSARKTIMEQCIFGNPQVLYVFDGRMDGSHGVVYSFDPNDAEHVELWQHYWFPDAAAQNDAPACGGKISVCYSAGITAGLMAHEFVRWNSSRKSHDIVPAQQRWIDLNGDAMRAVRW